MKNSNTPTITAICCALVGIAIAIVVWNASSSSGVPGDDITLVPSAEKPSSHTTAQNHSSDKPAVGEKSASDLIEPLVEDSSANDLNQIQNNNNETSNLSASKPVPFDVTRIGLDEMTDEDRRRTVIRTRTDEVFRASLIEEFRNNRDNRRAVSMASILYRSNTADVTALGEELTSSGELPLQRAGLDLLGRQQNRNLESRAVILNVLSYETDPEVLKSAMSAMSQPGHITPENRAELLTQFNTFSYNEDPDIRGHSYTLMGKWSQQINVNTQLLAGLNDESPTVRSSTIYALLDSRFPDQNIKDGLLSVLENPVETVDNRKVALRGLSRFDLSQDESDRVEFSSQSFQ